MLKRENKLLKEEHQKMVAIVKKYQTQKTDACVQTDPEEKQTEVEKK